MRLKCIVSGAIIVFMAFASGAVFAEEKVCVPGPCAGLLTALEFSRSHAEGIYVGTFKLKDQKGASNSAVENSEAPTYVEFFPKYGMGKSPKAPQQLQIPVNKLLTMSIVPSGGSAGEEAKRNWLSTLQSGKISHLAEYESSEKAFSTYLESVQSTSFNAALARVEVSTLDRKLRVANVPILERQDYVVLLLTGFPSAGANLLPRDFDLYPLEAYQRLK